MGPNQGASAEPGAGAGWGASDAQRFARWVTGADFERQAGEVRQAFRGLPPAAQRSRLQTLLALLDDRRAGLREVRLTGSLTPAEAEAWRARQEAAEDLIGEVHDRLRALRPGA